MCVLDEEGEAVLSRKVEATGQDLEVCLEEIAGLGGERSFGIDLLGWPATLLEAVLAGNGERVFAYRHSVSAGSLRKERQEGLHPALNGAPIDLDATLGQPFDHVGVAKAEAYVPPDGNSYHSIGKAAARESARRACREASMTPIAAPALASEPGAAVSPDGHATTANAPHATPPFVESTRQ